MASTRIALWECTRDPALVAFLKRGARDSGTQPAPPRPPKPSPLTSGSAARLRFNEDDRDYDGFAAISVHLGRGERFATRVLEDA